MSPRLQAYSPIADMRESEERGARMLPWMKNYIEQFLS
jgi:hypothetical protein